MSQSVIFKEEKKYKYYVFGYAKIRFSHNAAYIMLWSLAQVQMLKSLALFALLKDQMVMG